MTLDVAKALERLDSVETEKVRRDERVMDLIRSKEAASTTVKIGEVDIRIRATIGRDTKVLMTYTRDYAQNLTEETMTDEDLFQIDKLTALTIASLCLDEPFNDAGTWLAIGEEIGDLDHVVSVMLREIRAALDEVAAFRKDEARAIPPRAVKNTKGKTG